MALHALGQALDVAAVLALAALLLLLHGALLVVLAHVRHVQAPAHCPLEEVLAALTTGNMYRGICL